MRLNSGKNLAEGQLRTGATCALIVETAVRAIFTKNGYRERYKKKRQQSDLASTISGYQSDVDAVIEHRR